MVAAEWRNVTYDDVDRFVEIDDDTVFIDNGHCGNTPSGEFVDDVKNGG